MKDILPPESSGWRRLEESAAAVAENYAYGEVRLPLLESAELFARGLGATSEVVGKQMFAFEDAGGKSLALRPEGTAGVVRAFIENKLYSAGGTAKFYYLGPMFRRERPQAGRQRQFYQFGVEALGSTLPALDAEVVDLLVSFLAAAGVEDYSLAVNSVGCPDCRPEFKRKLETYLGGRAGELCSNCRRRVQTNVLRVLDCKLPACRAVAASGPVITEDVCGPCREQMEGFSSLLNRLSIPYRLDPFLVRGLDYYTRAVFEVFSPALGAQDAVAAGGRYDDLIEVLGGPPTPAVGFSAGLERIMLARSDRGFSRLSARGPAVYCVSLGEAALRENFILLSSLRRKGIRAEIDYNRRSLKSQMRSADKFGARWALIRGEDELARGAARLKDLETGKEEDVPDDKVLAVLAEKTSGE